MVINCYENYYPLIFKSDIYLGEYFFLMKKILYKKDFMIIKIVKLKVIINKYKKNFFVWMN